MAVRSIGPGVYEMTADNDELLEVVKVAAFQARTSPDTGSSGDVTVFTKVAEIASNGGIVSSFDNDDQRILWRTQGMNMNDSRDSTPIESWVHGLRVSMPPGAVLTVFTAE